MLAGAAKLRGCRTSRLPFTGSLVSRAVRFGCVGHAIVFGYYFLLRKSEFLGTKSIRARDVAFRWDTGPSVRLSEVQAGPASGFNHPPTSLVIRIPTSKTDRLGKGVVRVATLAPDPAGVCVCRSLWTHALQCGPFDANDAVFRGISATEVKHVMREVARSCGLDSTRVNVHSLRIGGLVQLSSAGCGSDLLRFAGRWASPSSVDAYFRATTEIYGQLSRMLSDPGRVSADGLATLYPAPSLVVQEGRVGSSSRR